MRFSGPIAAAHDMALRLPFARAACGAERTRIVTHTVVFLDRDSLKAKVRRLEEDNEVLRRAAVFFAGELDPRGR